MTLEEIVAKFAHSLDNFDTNDGQPSDPDLTRLREAVAPLLLQIPYDETGAVHNLIGRIRQEAAYIACYSEAFPKPTRVGAYDTNIDNGATAVVRARSEAAHKAKRANCATYETARRRQHNSCSTSSPTPGFANCETPSRSTPRFPPMTSFTPLQAGFTGRHYLNLLALHNEIQRYHLEVEDISEYINMIKVAQRQAGRAI